jgi:KipI family sensor histidine kinase inhibitor
VRVLRYGSRALLVECTDPDQVAVLHAELRRRREDGSLQPFDDLVPAELTVLIDGLDKPAALAAEIDTWDLSQNPPPMPSDLHRSAASGSVSATPSVVIPVCYDGPDLDYVAEQWQVSAAEAISLHSGFEYFVAFCGFAPGFAYLTGLPQQYQLPRRSTPRTAVPTGSVAVAGPYTGVYPRTSPGGWHLLGRTDAPLWDLDRPDPALLVPGTRVRFEAQEER